MKLTASSSIGKSHHLTQQICEALKQGTDVHYCTSLPISEMIDKLSKMGVDAKYKNLGNGVYVMNTNAESLQGHRSL